MRGLEYVDTDTHTEGSIVKLKLETYSVQKLDLHAQFRGKHGGRFSTIRAADDRTEAARL